MVTDYYTYEEALEIFFQGLYQFLAEENEREEELQYGCIDGVDAHYYGYEPYPH